MTKQLKQYDLEKYDTRDALLGLIEDQLTDLAEITGEMDLSHPQDLNFLRNNISYLKGYFCRYELISNDKDNPESS